MLGYVVAEGRGAANRLIFSVARRLAAEGWRLAGAVQEDLPQPGRRHSMTLHMLGDGDPIRISQELGAGARGCRLDAGALEQAALLAEQALRADPPPRLLIVNKFGKQELEGRGFRPAVGAALAAGVPVLTSVGPLDRAGFEAFAQGLGEALPDDVEAALGWARRAEVAQRTG